MEPVGLIADEVARRSAPESVGGEGLEPPTPSALAPLRLIAAQVTIPLRVLLVSGGERGRLGVAIRAEQSEIFWSVVV